jgi:hypothetical protein
MPRIRIAAASLTMGEAIRKLSLTPIGTPAATNPMKSGPAENEQNAFVVEHNDVSSNAGVSPVNETARRTLLSFPSLDGDSSEFRCTVREVRVFAGPGMGVGRCISLAQHCRTNHA